MVTARMPSLKKASPAALMIFSGVPFWFTSAKSP